MPAPTAELKLPPLQGNTPWIGLDRWRARDEFRFVLLSDRTGLPKPGIFEQAVRATNLLRPDFAIQIGDCIEGYTHQAETLSAEWAEFEAITSTLECPLFRVPGNHDVSNLTMVADWQKRFGALHYHFRYRDVLFLVLNTQDPPHTIDDFGTLDKVQDPNSKAEELDMVKLRQVYDASPRAFAEGVERAMNLDGPQPAHIGEAQAEWAARIVREHADARWTIVCMHMPAWQGELHPAMRRIRAALDGRPYTAFAGHLHNYQRRIIDGCDHIRLGPSGACYVTTRDEGNFDHVTLVTMTAEGPRIANLVLDGVLGVEGGVFRPRPMF